MHPRKTGLALPATGGELMIKLSAKTRKVNDPKVVLLCTEVTEGFPTKKDIKDMVIQG
jgi:hypothetical protein